MNKSHIKTESFKLAFEELKFLKELGVAPQIQRPEELFGILKQLAQKYEGEISAIESVP